MIKNILLISLVTFFHSNVFATSLLRVQSETFFSLRNDYKQKMEAPFLEFFGANYETLDHKINLDLNFSIFSDPQKTKSSEFNLYLLDARYDLIDERLRLKLGRSANFGRSIGSLLSDEISLKYFSLNKKFNADIYLGIERDPNSEDVSSANTNQLGTNFEYTTEGANPYQLSSKVEKKMHPKYSEDFVSFGAHGPLVDYWGSEFLFSSEYNMTLKSSRRIETGFDLFPSINTLNSWRFLTYNSKSYNEKNLDPIFSIISRGRLYEVGTSFDYRYSKKLSFGTSYFLDDYLLEGKKRVKGHKADMSMNYHHSFFEANNKIYYFYSYGGHAFGGKVNITLQPFDAYELNGGGDVTYYKKITSAKGMAYNSYLMIGKRFNNKLKWLLGGEVNSNNILPYDLRFLTKLVYDGWSRFND